VVVSIHPLFDLVRQVAGEHADVRRVLPPGASPHTFDPTPARRRRIAAADLVVVNGGLDLWLRELVEATGSRATVVEVIADARVLDALREAFPELVPADGASALGFNTHVWLDPLVMREAAYVVAEALTEVDPANAASYAAPLPSGYGSELLELDAELSALLSPVAGCRLRAVPRRLAVLRRALRPRPDRRDRAVPGPRAEPRLPALRAR
jgi:ABC-type Zn uptake system ZnuABC Zn-binding protein ZnuA